MSDLVGNQNVGFLMTRLIYEPCHDKTHLRGFRPGPTQTVLYCHRIWLDWKFNFGFRKKRKFTLYEAKRKALISCAVTGQLICVFVLAYSKSLFSHDAAHFKYVLIQKWRSSILEILTLQPLFILPNMHRLTVQCKFDQNRIETTFVCCLVYQGSTDDPLLLQISSGVVWKTRELHLSRNTLYLFESSSLLFHSIKT